MTRVRFAVAAPAGEIVPGRAELGLVLEGNPDGVTYGAYFAALEAFLRGQAAPALAEMAAAALGPGLPAPAEMRIRAEKHGALYHPASVELAYADGRTFRGGVLAAGTALARSVLTNEATWLNRLRERLGEPLLPRVLAATPAEGGGPLALALVEWFAGFCEFHVDASGVVQLWDFGRGLVPLRRGQAAELYGRAAYILGRCYDPGSGGRVFPWHHAAGDFVAKLEGGGLDVRLTTVRDYGTGYDMEPDRNSPLASLAGFVLETTLRLRLDRVDGVGAPAWLPAECLDSGVEGVLAGVAAQSPQAAALVAETRAVLASFPPEDLAAALAGAAEDCGPFYRDLLAARLPGHARELLACLGAAGM